MSQFFSSLVRFLQQKHGKTLLITVGIVLVGACFGATSGDTPAYTESDMTKNIIEIFDLIFGMLALVLGPMVVLCGWLLSPDWTMGDFFGLRAYFQEVWVLVANIVYIIFALMLLFMAIMQIFGGDESQYAFKRKLPKFLIGILIVPFTWLIVSWTLSFANQAVAAVLSIPMGSISKLNTGGVPGQQNTSMWHKKVLPTEFDFTATGESGYGKGIKCESGTTSTGVKCISPAEFLTYNQAGPFFIIMIYAYNIFKIQEADLTPLKNFCPPQPETGTSQSAKSCVQNLMGIVRDFGLALIVTVFFAIMLIALCWVLLMRAIKLWIYIMLSPLFGLAFFTGEGLGSPVGEAGESGFGQVGFMAFFKLAMVPVIVSAVLAFGLLFVGVVRDNFHGDIKDPNQKEFCTKQGVGYMVTYCITQVDDATNGPTYESRLIIGTDSRQGSKSSLITLNFGNSFSKIIGSSEASSIAAGAVSGGISSVEDIFAHLILTMLALVFMFMGVKAAVQYDEVTKAAFAPFAKLGESVGNFVAHSPSYLPLPHPAFAALTPAGMKGLATAINTKVSQDEAKVGRTMQEMLGDRSLMGLKASLDSNSNSVDDLNQKMGPLNERGARILQTTTVGGSIPHLVDEIRHFAEEGGVTMTETQRRGIKNITDTNSAQEFFSDNKDLLKSLQDFYKDKNAPAVAKFLETLTNAATSVKQVDGKDLRIEKINNQLHFNIGDSKIQIDNSTGNLAPGSIISSTQKVGFKELAEKSGVSSINSIDTMNDEDVKTVLQNGIGITSEQLSGMTSGARKQLLKSLVN